MTTTNPWLEMFLSAQRNAVQEGINNFRRFASIPQAREQAASVKVGTTPADVVYQSGTMRLLHYRRDEPSPYAEPVLVCYALINRPYILDLQTDRSVIRQLLKRGLDVYMIDWGVPTEGDKHRRIYDYVCGLLNDTVDVVRNRAGTPNLNLLGYCMGGAMSAMYTTIYPEKIKTLTLLAAPIDFSDQKSLLHLWCDKERFDVDAMIDTYGNAPPEFLENSFQMMRPMQNYVEKYLNLADKLYDEGFVENFFAMEQWVRDNIPVAGETFREFVKRLYQGNELTKGTFNLNGIPCKLDKITCPLQLLAAKADHLVVPESTLGIVPFVKSKDIKTTVLEAGHVGLVVGSKAHKTDWPVAAAWIADRSSPAGRSTNGKSHATPAAPPAPTPTAPKAQPAVTRATTATVAPAASAPAVAREPEPSRESTAMPKVSFDSRIVEKVAVITGAGSGIGQAVAFELARRGIKAIAMADRSEQVKKVAADINAQRAETVAVPFIGDASDPEFCRHVYASIEKGYGVADICVPAAGITRDAISVKLDKQTGKASVYPVELFREVTEVNLLAPVYWGLQMVAQIAEDRHRRSMGRWDPAEGVQGTIIFIGSVSSQGNKGQIAYAVSKAGLEGAPTMKEAIFHGVRCTVIHPGFTDTPMVRALGEKIIAEQILPFTQLRRLIRPDEIADAICFMISNSAVSGELWADAGWHPSA